MFCLLQLNLATNLGLVCFCWGDENNSKETIKFLKSLNIHGIIYDKMDKLTEKNVKVSNILKIVFISNGLQFYFKKFKHFANQKETKVQSIFQQEISMI